MKILFPTDFSATAHHAFIYALQVADKWDASIVLLHVYQLPTIAGTGLAPELEQFYRSIDDFQFKNYQDEIPVLKKIASEAGFDYIQISHVLLEGPTVDSILELVKKDGLDMIVMGTTGASGLKEVVLGSVAGEVLEHASCPVLVVPQKAVFDGNIDQIAFTTNFTEDEAKALEETIAFAAPFGAHVHCINIDTAHIAKYTSRAEAWLQQFSDASGLSVEILDRSDIIQGITEYMDTHAIDIISMVSHERNFFQELFNYSRAKMLSYHTKVPILVFPEKILE
jgi:nucleotide-binding universal stress UspA family protein